ncbi:hypothetical protein RI054_03g19660 [Pseudoscourfieldia marina]
MECNRARYTYKRKARTKASGDNKMAKHMHMHNVDITNAEDIPGMVRSALEDGALEDGGPDLGVIHLRQPFTFQDVFAVVKLVSHVVVGQVLCK